MPTLIPYGGTIVTNTSAPRPGGGGGGGIILGGDVHFVPEEGPEENPGGDVGGPRNPTPSPTPSTCGPFVVPHAASLEGIKCVGDVDCVPLVQNPLEILGQQYPGLPHTRNRQKGEQVKGNTSIKVGTVIATFDKDGKYPTTTTPGYKHAAIYLSQDSEGIRVIDQYKPLKNVQKRHIEFDDNRTPSNNGNQFSIVMTNSRSRVMTGKGGPENQDIHLCVFAPLRENFSLVCCNPAVRKVLIRLGKSLFLGSGKATTRAKRRITSPVEGTGLRTASPRGAF